MLNKTLTAAVDGMDVILDPMNTAYLMVRLQLIDQAVIMMKEVTRNDENHSDDDTLMIVDIVYNHFQNIDVIFD